MNETLTQYETEVIRGIAENLGGDIRSYSGRGMFGKECLGIQTASDGFQTFCPFKFGVEVGLRNDLYDNDEEYPLSDVVIGSMRSDSMGLGTIYYWPATPPPFEEDMDDEEDFVDEEVSLMSESSDGWRLRD